MPQGGRVLISGATGFIGTHLIPRLVEEGYEVYALQRQTAGRYVQGQTGNAVFSDLRDFFAVRKVVAELQPDVVIHLAAISPVAYSYDHPQEVISVNALGTVNLAEACLREVPSFKHFLFAGTSEEYGNQKEFPIKETAELKPNSPYSVSKVAADKYLQYMWGAYRFPVTVLRPFNTYGRKQDAHFMVERIITQALCSSQIRLGDIKAVRDLLYVDDHIEAYLACLRQGDKAKGQTFNFCTSQGWRVEEVVQLVSKLLGKKLEIVAGTIPKRPLDINMLVGDNAKSQKTLGWAPKVPLEEGLRLTIEHWKKKLA